MSKQQRLTQSECEQVVEIAQRILSNGLARENRRRTLIRLNWIGTTSQPASNHESRAVIGLNHLLASPACAPEDALALRRLWAKDWRAVRDWAASTGVAADAPARPGRKPKPQPEDATPFARSLRRLREAAGLSLEQLGERAGVSFRVIAYYEAGRKVALEEARKIANALGATVDDMCREQEG